MALDESLYILMLKSYVEVCVWNNHAFFGLKQDENFCLVSRILWNLDKEARFLKTEFKWCLRAVCCLLSWSTAPLILILVIEWILSNHTRNIFWKQKMCCFLYISPVKLWARGQCSPLCVILRARLRKCYWLKIKVENNESRKIKIKNTIAL